MKKIVAYCGLLCNECPAFIATQLNNEEQKIELSKQWTNDNYIVNPEDINCDGCNGGCSGRTFKFCRECGIRLCGLGKEIENCAFCDEYPCDKLSKPLEQSPKNKELLDEIRNKLIK